MSGYSANKRMLPLDVGVTKKPTPAPPSVTRPSMLVLFFVTGCLNDPRIKPVAEDSDSLTDSSLFGPVIERAPDPDALASLSMAAARPPSAIVKSITAGAFSNPSGNAPREGFTYRLPNTDVAVVNPS